MAGRKRSALTGRLVLSCTVAMVLRAPTAYLLPFPDLSRTGISANVAVTQVSGPWSWAPQNCAPRSLVRDLPVKQENIKDSKAF